MFGRMKTVAVAHLRLGLGVSRFDLVTMHERGDRDDRVARRIAQDEGLFVGGRAVCSL